MENRERGSAPQPDEVPYAKRAGKEHCNNPWPNHDDQYRAAYVTIKGETHYCLECWIGHTERLSHALNLANGLLETLANNPDYYVEKSARQVENQSTGDSYGEECNGQTDGEVSE